MTGDLGYLQARLPNYGGYGDEHSIHDSDMRVRAFVGNILSETQARLSDTLDSATQKVLEDVLFRCMFTDQVFIRKFEHARLDPPLIAGLVRSDRTLVELGERALVASAAGLRDILIEIDKQFEFRRAPEALKDAAS